MNPELCPLCDRENDCQLCGVDSHKGPCWCASIPVPDELLARVVPELKNRACICQKCIGEYSQRPQELAPDSPPEGDFYFDSGGLMVFTADYHLRRGYCCGSGCRHCPYPNSK
jgi:hypothetical protein